MRTSFDIVLLLFTTCLVTGFKQFSTYFENTHVLGTVIRGATADPVVVHRARTVFHLMTTQYVLIIVWLAFSLYLEVFLSRRGQKDIIARPVRLLQGYTVVSSAMLLFLIGSTLWMRFEWTGKLIRRMEAGELDYPQETLDFLKKVDPLLDINYIFSIGIDIFIVFIIVQLWEEKTINEFRIRLEGDRTIDVASLDGKSLQKYHFGSNDASKACLSSSAKKMSLADELACMLA